MDIDINFDFDINITNFIFIGFNLLIVVINNKNFINYDYNSSNFITKYKVIINKIGFIDENYYLFH